MVDTNWKGGAAGSGLGTTPGLGVGASQGAPSLGEA